MICGICWSSETIQLLDGALQGSGAIECCRTHCVRTLCHYKCFLHFVVGVHPVTELCFFCLDWGLTD